MTRILALVIGALAAAVSLPPGPALAWYSVPSRFTPSDTLAALEPYGPIATCLVSVETGGSFAPNRVSETDDLGPAGLHRGGRQWREYMAGWGSDPFDPYTTIPYLEWALFNGEGRAWAGWGECAAKFPEAVP